MEETISYIFILIAGWQLNTADGGPHFIHITANLIQGKISSLCLCTSSLRAVFFIHFEMLFVNITDYGKYIFQSLTLLEEEFFIVMATGDPIV